jgi:hypothetical protein
VDVDSSIVGTVVLYSSYNSTTGKLILAKPTVVVSISPNAATLTAITLYPTSAQATAGDIIGAQLWGSYSDGSASQLYIPMDMSIQFTSSNPNVASISPDGLIQAKTAGSSALTVSYQGLTAQTTVTVTALFATAALGNISTRLEVGTGDNALIGGFIVTGTQAKKVIVRGLGPSLPVSNGLADPTLELHDSTGAVIASNDDWQDTQQADIIATTIPPTNDLESAIVMSLNPGAYTAIVRGKMDTIGVGLVEVYDLDQTVDSKLANISTRGFVDTGDNVMIGGTIVTGTGPANVLIRVANALQDPTLELHDGQGNVIATNDNWQDSQADAIQATGIPPSDSRESAILQSLAPGAYTAIVRGAGDTTGVALVEAYQLP